MKHSEKAGKSRTPWADPAFLWPRLDGNPAPDPEKLRRLAASAREGVPRPLAAPFHIFCAALAAVLMVFYFLFVYGDLVSAPSPAALRGFFMIF